MEQLLTDTLVAIQFFEAYHFICHQYQVDDWNEATFLGAAVGILITVSLAAAAAVVLVLVRNRVGNSEASNIC